MSQDAHGGTEIPLPVGLSGSGNLTAQLSVTYSDRKWPQMWRYVQRAHKILHATASAPADHSELRANAMTFFILCTHLEDWLHADPSTKNQVRYLRADSNLSEAMKICREAANTSKHSGRDGKGLDVHVRTVSLNPTDSDHTMTAKVEYEVNGEHCEWEVIALADECMDWWEKYIKDHNLDGA